MESGTLNQCKTLENGKPELETLNIYILGVGENRSTNNAAFTSSEQKIIFAGVEENESAADQILDKDKRKHVLRY